MIIIARANTTFVGIDYTFRNTISHLLNNNEKEEKNNNKIKNDQKIKQHISDLEKTISLNKECINTIIPSLTLKQNQKKILLNSMQKITEYFEEKKNYRNKMKQINSKILMNKQIIEEIKRTRDENIFIHKDQIDNLNESIRKKGTLIKQFYKKFSEVEIFIQRECKTPEHVEKYGHWTTFTIIPFMKSNEDILKRKYYYEYEVDKNKELIENLNKTEIKETTNDNFEKIKNYYENKNNLINRKIELLKFRLNTISNSNTKKSLVPTFKSKNPISSLDVKLNLLDPHVVELNLKNEKKLGEYQGILNEKNIEIKLNDNDFKEINDKFEEEIKKEEGQNDIKENVNNDLNGLNEFGNISDIEDDKEN